MESAATTPMPPDNEVILANVRAALAEDIGTGDITAGLIDDSTNATAQVITREEGVLCGRPWVNAVFGELSAAFDIHWRTEDGAHLAQDQVLLEVTGPAAKLLTAERTALNFLQLLSGTATTCRRYADLVAHTGVKLLDTRKTIPGLRLAQKYAVRCGGCHNHRIGLFDAFLIKENHIAACGGIPEAVTAARHHAPGKPVEVEVETLQELDLALAAGADRIMLDNFSLDDLRAAVARTEGAAELEASGNVTDDTLLP
ncbi:MAG: carboxylating nicotinate-nucleotide diphosphorylase, partial [Halioglobus sp.]|nr:carboxylating nicotinate-nucleotide diphosphorylase [Halioglobus sp.]